MRSRDGPRPRWIADEARLASAGRLVRAYADAYVSSTDRERVIEVAVLRTRRSWYGMKQHAEIDGGGRRRMWDEGVGGVIKRREAWLDRHGATLTAAVTAP